MADASDGWNVEDQPKPRRMPFPRTLARLIAEAGNTGFAVSMAHRMRAKTPSLQNRGSDDASPEGSDTCDVTEQPLTPPLTPDVPRTNTASVENLPPDLADNSSGLATSPSF